MKPDRFWKDCGARALFCFFRNHPERFGMKRILFLWAACCLTVGVVSAQTTPYMAVETQIIGVLFPELDPPAKTSVGLSGAVGLAGDWGFVEAAGFATADINGFFVIGGPTLSSEEHEDGWIVTTGVLVEGAFLPESSNDLGKGVWAVMGGVGKSYVKPVSWGIIGFSISAGLTYDNFDESLGLSLRFVPFIQFPF